MLYNCIQSTPTPVQPWNCDTRGPQPSCHQASQPRLLSILSLYSHRGWLCQSAQVRNLLSRKPPPPLCTCACPRSLPKDKPLDASRPEVCPYLQLVQTEPLKQSQHFAMPPVPTSQILDNLREKVQHFEAVVRGQFTCDGGDGVGEPERREDGAVPPGSKPLLAAHAQAQSVLLITTLAGRTSTGRSVWGLP